MNAFLGSFPISFLLRGMFSGVFFVVSYCVVTWHGPKQFINSGNVFSVALPVALVAGVTVYGLHRSLVFPLLEWIFNWDCAKKKRGAWWTLISKNTIIALAKRCDEKCEDAGKKVSERAKYMELWGDYIHLQYTSGWCIIGGSITGAIISDGNFLNHPMNGWLCAAAIVFFVAALTSNWRSFSVEEIWSDPHKLK